MSKFREIYQTISEYDQDIPIRYRETHSRILKTLASLVSDYVLTDIEISLVWSSFDNLLDEVICLPSLWNKNVQDNIIYFAHYLREYALENELYETMENIKRFNEKNFYKINELEGYDRE